MRTANQKTAAAARRLLFFSSAGIPAVLFFSPVVAVYSPVVTVFSPVAGTFSVVLAKVKAAAGETASRLRFLRFFAFGLPTGVATNTRVRIFSAIFITHSTYFLPFISPLASFYEYNCRHDT